MTEDPHIHLNAPIMQGGGGGGGGGGLPPLPTELKDVPQHTFQFTFDVPFIPATTARDSVTVTAAGIPITLRDVRYAPSATLGVVCVPEQRLAKGETLRVDAPIYSVDFSLDAAPIPDEPNCYPFTLLGVLASQDNILRVTFKDIVSNRPNITDETWAAFEQALQDAGITVELFRMPDGFSFGSAEMLPLTHEQFGQLYAALMC
jgi:hypothetical protein